MCAVASLTCAAACVAPPATEHERQFEAIENRPWEDPHEVIVEINGRKITRGDFYRRVLQKFGARTLLSGVIKEELFLQEVERLGLAVSDEEIREEVAKRLDLEAREAGGIEELEAIYAREGLSLADVREDYASRIRAERLIVKVVQSRRRVDQAALRQHYQETWARSRYRVSHIAFRYRVEGLPDDLIVRQKQEAIAKALRVKEQLASGAEFADIARAESEDELTRDRGGDMGMYVTMEDPMDAEIREAIFSLEKGGVSEPIDYKRLGSIHVFKVTDVLPHKGYEEVSAAMRTELMERVPDREEVERVLAELSGTARIEIFGRPAPAMSERTYDDPVLPGDAAAARAAHARFLPDAEGAE